jgi:hypothetical protein
MRKEKEIEKIEAKLQETTIDSDDYSSSTSTTEEQANPTPATSAQANMAFRQRIELLNAQIAALVPERARLRSALKLESLKVTYQRELSARNTNTSAQQLATPEMFAEAGRLGQQLAAIEGQISVAVSKRQELQTEIEFQAKCFFRF